MDVCVCVPYDSSQRTQSTLSEESKEAYNLLIEKPTMEISGSSHGHYSLGLPVCHEPEESNPLRMLRSGGLTVVRPKIRGNKHQAARESRELKVNYPVTPYQQYFYKYYFVHFQKGTGVQVQC